MKQIFYTVRYKMNPGEQWKGKSPTSFKKAQSEFEKAKQDGWKIIQLIKEYVNL